MSPRIRLSVPRVRVRLRTLMIAIAIMALPLGLWINLHSRRARFERLYQHHRSQFVGMVGDAYGGGVIKFISITPHGGPIDDRQRASNEYHIAWMLAYREAARRPWWRTWLPVRPSRYRLSEPGPPPPPGDRHGSLPGGPQPAGDPSVAPPGPPG